MDYNFNLSINHIDGDETLRKLSIFASAFRILTFRT